ncbi:MAG: sugar ABC transporter substrate-binding protein [Treponema sp.]|jgi:ABC-type sugar transport system substrate-binding protein|nr:sugar ABC transporter substrate-binding protein [Treponema sp.]
MNVRKIVVMFSVLLTAAAVSAPCGGRTDSRAGQASKTVALSINALDEYQTEWFGYFESEAEARGYRVVMTNAEGKVDKQISDVESLIQLKPAIIIIRAVDSDGAVPAFEACEEAGIPTIDSAFGTNYPHTLKVLQSQYNLCALQAQYCIDWLEANPGKKLKVGYVWGVQGVSGTIDRYTGWKETLLKAYPDRVEILTEKVCNWSATETMAAVEDWLQAFPEMNCIVAMSDEMAIAAANVLQAAKKTLDDCIVVGIDGSPNAQRSLREGVMSATVFTSKKAEARFTIDYAERIMRGEKLAGQTIDPGQTISALMTKDNIEQILSMDR